MFYCDKDPYYTNSNGYHRNNIDHYTNPYWLWMKDEYKCVLLTKQGSFSDKPDEHWAFKEEKDMMFFKLRWS